MTTLDDTHDSTTQSRVPPANGAWIKMRTNLWDDPRVASLCDVLSCDEARVCGGLFRLWSLADTHSTDGRLQYSAAALNRKVGIEGFAEAMQAVGWLVSVDGLMTLPRFDEHNGGSAKRRAQEAARKANQRRRNEPQAGVTLQCGQQSGQQRDTSVSKRKRKSKKQNQNEDVEAAGRSPPAPSSDLPPFEDIEHHWNNSLAVSHTLTDGRRNKLLTRWKDADFRKRWREAIDRISRSNFCRGLNDRGWKADLDWFLKLDTITKVMEGKYDNHNNATRPARGNTAASREQANADAFAAVYGAEVFDEDPASASTALFDEENAGTHAASTRHLG